MRTHKVKKLPLIMIADNDEDERCLLRAVLRLKGFNVIEATNGREAVSLAIERRPDLLMMDLGLPIVSGAAAIRQIRKQSGLRNRPIVAYSQDRRRSQSKQNGTRGLTVQVEKPIRYEELDDLLDRFLPGRRLQLASRSH